MYDSLKKHLDEDVRFHIRCLSHIIYYVTEEEDLFISQLQVALTKYAKTTKVWNPAFGLQPINSLVEDWESKAHQEHKETQEINSALIQIYKDNQEGERSFYVITDADRYMNDPQVIRRLLNIIHQLNRSESTAKILILVSPKLVVHQKLAKYVEVVHDKGLPEEGLRDHVDDICKKLGVTTPVTVKNFKGLTATEVEASIAQSVVDTQLKNNGVSKVDLKLVADYKRRQLKKTDLLTHVDVSNYSFNEVGGVKRFKGWVEKTKANWTEEGQNFGLVPPKGIIALGVWGCGKSLSIKAMAHAWKLNLLQLELGKLRQSGVGDSEANVYRIIAMAETMAPCILWADEADKSFSGGQSSALTDGGTTNRMIGILSTWLQETKSQVCLAMTANNISMVPPEFIRRTNKRFFFDLPSEDERIEILKIHLTKRRQDPTQYNLAALAEAANRMAGSEVEQAIEEAMTDSFNADKDGLDEDILTHELEIRPRLLLTLGDELKAMRSWVGFDSKSDEGVRASLASNPSEDQVRVGGE